VSRWRRKTFIALRGLPIYFKVILKIPSVVIISVAILLSLSACSKRLSGRYVCRQDAFEFKPDGTLTISDVKTGALEMKGSYKIKSDQISLIPEKGRTLNGVMKGNSIIVKGLPPLTREGAQ
jgi:hypothetical protein